MPINFPANPTTGDIFVFNQKKWRWNGYAWDRVADAAGAQIYYSDTVPSDANTGDFWFESDTGSFFAYLDDGDSLQWVEVGGLPGPTGADGSQVEAEALVWFLGA